MLDGRKPSSTRHSLPAYPDIPVKKGTVASRIRSYNFVRDDAVVLARRRSRALERLTTTLEQRKEALAQGSEHGRSSSATSTNRDARSASGRSGHRPALTENARSGFGRRATPRFAVPAERTSSYDFSSRLGSDVDHAYSTPLGSTTASETAQLRGYFSRGPVIEANRSACRIGLDATNSTHAVPNSTSVMPSSSASRAPENEETSKNREFGADISTAPKSPESAKKPKSDIEAVLGRALNVVELTAMIEEVKRQIAPDPDEATSDSDDTQLGQGSQQLRDSIKDIIASPADSLSSATQWHEPITPPTDAVQQRFADTPLQEPLPLAGQGHLRSHKLLSTASPPDDFPYLTRNAPLDERLPEANTIVSDTDSTSSSTHSMKEIGGEDRLSRAHLRMPDNDTSETRYSDSSDDSEGSYDSCAPKTYTSMASPDGFSDRGRKRQIQTRIPDKRHTMTNPSSRAKRRRRRLPSSAQSSDDTSAENSSPEKSLLPSPLRVAIVEDKSVSQEMTSAGHSYHDEQNTVEAGHDSYPRSAAPSPDDKPYHQVTPELQVGSTGKLFRQPSVHSFASSRYSGSQTAAKSSWWKFGVANKKRQSETAGRGMEVERRQLTLKDDEGVNANSHSPEIVAVSAITAKGTMTPSNADVSRPQSLRSYSSTLTTAKSQAGARTVQRPTKQRLPQRRAQCDASASTAVIEPQENKFKFKDKIAEGNINGRKHKTSVSSMSAQHGQGNQVRIRGFSVVVNFDGRDDLIITAQLPTLNSAETHPRPLPADNEGESG